MRALINEQELVPVDARHVSVPMGYLDLSTAQLVGDGKRGLWVQRNPSSGEDPPSLPTHRLTRLTIINIDSPRAEVIYDSARETLTLMLAGAKQVVDLTGFNRSTIKLTDAFGKVELSRKEEWRPINLEVDYLVYGGSTVTRFIKTFKLEKGKWEDAGSGTYYYDRYSPTLPRYLEGRDALVPAARPEAPDFPVAWRFGHPANRNGYRTNF